MAKFDADSLCISSSMTSEEELVKYRDAIVASFCAIANWIYDIANQSMIFTYQLEDELVTRTVRYENFKQNLHDLKMIHPEDEPIFDVMCAELDAGKESIFAEFRAVIDNYQPTWLRYIGHAVYSESGQISKIYGRRFDVSREKESKESLNSYIQDTLTGLYYRDRARELMAEALDKKPEFTSAMIILDVDDFRLINEASGKMQGDVTLQTISGLINTNFMSKDIVGRIAGDQFFILCEDISHEKVVELVKSVQTRVYESVSKPSGAGVTVSAGISFYPEDGTDFESLYAKADIALAVAKKTGKNRYFIYDRNSTSETGIGYTLAKMGSFEDDEIRVIKSNKKVNKKLFDYAFEVLSKEDELKTAFIKIFEEVCLYYGLDRAFLVEIDRGVQQPKISSKWCKEPGDDFEKHNLYTVDAWMQLETEEADDGYFIFDSGRCGSMDFFRTIVQMKNPPVSSIQFRVMDGEELYAMVGFDCFENHEFKKNEIATLKSIVRLISSYILSQQVKNVLEAETIINQNVMDAQRVVYYVIDGNTYELKYISKYAKALFPQAEYGRKCYETLMKDNRPCDTCPMKCGEGNEIKSIQVYDEKDDKWLTFSATNMKNTESADDVLICVTDVTEFLNKVRGKDTLTIADSFDKFVVEATKQIMRKEQQFGIICAGIQEFSKINDEFGYVVGDEVLKRYAELMKADIIEGEILCRVKGDDFVLLLKQDDSDNSEQVLRTRFAEYSNRLTGEFRNMYPGIEIKCFAGEYLVSQEDRYVNHCVDNALKARRVALNERNKNDGFFIYSHEIAEEEKKTDELVKKMKESLKKDGFKVFFQPKVNVDNRDIIGAEALVRLQDTDGKMISPGLFVPLAEKNGMIIDIDFFVYEKTFALMRKWLDEGKKVPLISVNVSRLHLTDDELPEKIYAISSKYNIDPKLIELEITESVFYDDTDRLIRLVERLKSFGYIISMDDFGSGYSTLNIMKSLPVDVIKIDGGFFMRNEMDAKSKAIISAIIQLTKNLNFDTVSEGVETEEQVQFIREQGGKCVQGYYFYKPMSADDFAKLI